MILPCKFIADFFLILAAGSAFCECAGIQLKLGSRHDAATAFADATNCYRSVQSMHWYRRVCYKAGVAILTQSGPVALSSLQDNVQSCRPMNDLDSLILQEVGSSGGGFLSA